MQPLTIASLLMVAAGLVVAVSFVLTPQQGTPLLKRRLARFGTIDDAGPPIDSLLLVDEEDLNRPFFERAIRPVMNRLEKLVTPLSSAGQIAGLERKLVAAGGFMDLNAPGFLAFQLACAGAGGALGFLLALLLGLDGLMFWAFPLIGFVIGYMVPTFKLGGKVKERHVQILEGLPNALDLLTISVEAGLGLDAALMRVAEKYHNALADELLQVLNEMKLGRPRRDALVSLSERCQVEELTAFIQAVVQSEQMGTSLGTTLRIQSEEMRRKRRQRAEELGAKAPLKMLLPMVGCIFPTIFIVLLGPAALDVVGQMGTGK